MGLHCLTIIYLIVKKIGINAWQFLLVIVFSFTTVDKKGDI